MKPQLEFLTYGAEVARYHTVQTLQRETVGHHSHGVAMICLVLEPNASAALLRAALVHDLAEQHTGDIPSPAKRQYGIGRQVDELEQKLLAEYGFAMPGLTPAEARILKLADIAQGAMFCVRELSMGNRRMRVAFDRYMAYASGMMLAGAERELFSAISKIKFELDNGVC